MAVEAHNPNLFPSQFVANRDLMNFNQGNYNLNNTQMIDGYKVPFLAKTMADQAKVGDSVFALKKSDSVVTYNLPNTPRKRSRDDFDHQSNAYGFVKNRKYSDISSSFLDNGNMNLQTQIEQLEIDQIISQHAEKMRIELEMRRKCQFRMLVSSIEEKMVKKLKEKDEEVQRIGKLNWALQERVKTLFFENQLWRDMAQSNEATANSLRNNLEQLLAHVSNDGVTGGGIADDDVESCCDSNDFDGRTLAMEKTAAVRGGDCRKCGERESAILLLPCRHLCVCTSCGSTLHTCPVCNSNITASLHVNMSSN